MESVKVTVIIPVYEVEAWLTDCLDSVLGQTLQDIQVICIDDASPDGCGAILDAYAARDSRLEVIHLDRNMRQGYGRNLGLERARGEYIYLLDSDDMIRPGALEELAAAADADRLDGIFFDCSLHYDDESLRMREADCIPEHAAGIGEEVTSGEELYRRFYAAGDWNVYVWRQFWRREFLREHGLHFPVQTEHEDEVFSAEAVMLARRVRYLRRQYPVHRYRPGSVMTRAKNARDFHGYFCVFRELARFGRVHGIRLPEYERNTARMYELAVRYYPLFAEEDPARWFRTPEEMEAYRLFAASLDAQETLRRANAARWAFLSSREHFCVYGAGQIARRVMEQLLESCHIPDCVLVSSMEGNPELFCGRPVLPAASWEMPGSCTVILAVSSVHHEALAAMLKGKGCEVVYYRQGQVTVGEAAGMTAGEASGRPRI